MDRRAGGGLGEVRVEAAHHTHPQLDVLPLELAHQLAVGVPEAVQLTVVQGDERAVVEREVDVPLDQRVEDRPGATPPAPSASASRRFAPVSSDSLMPTSSSANIASLPAKCR